MMQFIFYLGLITVVYAFVCYYVHQIHAMIIGCITGIFIAIVCIVASKVIKYCKKKKYLDSPLSVLDHLQGEEFEKYAKAWFEEQGYKASLTPRSNDYGADLILTKNKEITIVQAKRYKSKVGVAAVQQIVAAKAYYKADKCIVFTNYYFTNQAKKLAKANDVKLIDRNDLLESKKVNIREKKATPNRV